MVDTSVILSGIRLKNPIMTASGTFGYGYEFAEIYDINTLSGIAVKGTTREPRFGNPTPRVAECDNGLINSVGLQNPGIDKVLAYEIPKLRSCFKNTVILNIGAFSPEEYAECVKKADGSEQVDIIELNVSCPNVHSNGDNFGTSVEGIKSVLQATRGLTKKPLFVKLSPNVTNIRELAIVSEGEGADGLSLINTLLGMRIDIKKGRPVLANIMGGYSGKAIFPVALRAVYQVYSAVKIPIIGIGGISSPEDVIEMMLAGATAVQIGSANLINPTAAMDIATELPYAMQKLGYTSVKDLIGGAH